MWIDKRKVQQAFAAASHSYDSVAHLQREVGRALLQSVDIANHRGTLLDIGCGTGFLTAELLAASACQNLVALDLAMPMLHTTREKLANHRHVHYVCADAEALPLVSASIDSVFSNLALQWCGNLSAVFTDIRRVLKPDGAFIFSTFGNNTLQELKAAWKAVDNHQHVNDFYDEATIVRQLQQAGFRHITSHSQQYYPHYHSVQELMRELKQIGAHNVLPRRNKAITRKSALQAMLAAYPQQPLASTITATFDVITIHARP